MAGSPELAVGDAGRELGRLMTEWCSGGPSVARSRYRHLHSPGLSALGLRQTHTVFYVTGADNTASLRLHAALGFQETNRFESHRSAVGVDVLSQLARTTADPDVAGTGTQ